MQFKLTREQEFVRKMVAELDRQSKKKGRPPCIHGNLCRAIWNKKGYIYSVRCPYGCEFYKAVKKGGNE